jgi:LysM repeat protein
VVESTLTMTITTTATVTITPTPTATATIEPTFTPLPPVEYTVASGDTCSSIAGRFKVSINSIILSNNLPASCILSIGTKLKIPQPTPTASPQPSATLSKAQSTDTSCQKVDYVVQANDTLSKIAGNYAVPIAAIRSYNGLPNDTVYEGQKLSIPLCERAATPGATPTATPPPPYPAPNLLLPADGAAFTLADDVISLQWASVGELRSNEAYAVSVEDITEGTGRRLVEYVTDTKFIIPSSFQPTSSSPHIMRWWVMPVRQTGTTGGKPIWEPAGTASAQRVFSWSGVAGALTTKSTTNPTTNPTATQTPKP